MWRARCGGILVAMLLTAACSSSNDEPAAPDDSPAASTPLENSSESSADDDNPADSASAPPLVEAAADESIAGIDSEPPPPESLDRPGSPEPAVDEMQDPTDDAQALNAAEHLEARGGIIDFATSVDGDITSRTTMLTTDQGTVHRTITSTGLEHTDVLTAADPSGQTAFTFSFESELSIPEGQEYRDRAGYNRSADGAVTGSSGVEVPPWRTIERIESLGSIDDPLPLTGATFDWGEYFNREGGSIYDVGETWSVEIGGMVEPKVLPTATEPGRCLLLYGTATSLTLGKISRGVTEDYDPPEPGLIVDGEIRPSDGTFQLDGGRGLKCDVFPAFEAGYTISHEGGSTVGETIPFYAAWWVPDTSTIDGVVMGDWYDSSGARTTAYFSTDTIDTIEPPVRPESPYGYLTDMKATASDSVAHFGGGGEWTLSFEEVINLPITETLAGGEFVDCYAIVGTATLNTILADDGISRLGTPGLVADGLHRQGGSPDCDTSSLEANRYTTHTFVADGMVVGETRGFFDTLYVEKRLTPEWITLEDARGTLILELP